MDYNNILTKLQERTDLKRDSALFEAVDLLGDLASEDDKLPHAIAEAIDVYLASDDFSSGGAAPQGGEPQVRRAIADHI